MFHKLLLPTDGSDPSIAAAHTAIEIARLARVPLQAVFVIEPYAFSNATEVRPVELEDYKSKAQQDAASAFERIIQAAAAQGVECKTSIAEHAQPAVGIVETAESSGADLIVMGSHGRSGLVGLVLGSVAAEVVRLSTVPVLIVK